MTKEEKVEVKKICEAMKRKIKKDKELKNEKLKNEDEVWILEKPLVYYSSLLSRIIEVPAEFETGYGERTACTDCLYSFRRKIRNHKKEKDEAVKDVRIQYDSVCDMFHKREREYEDRITDLNNELINQLETGKQKTIYINQLKKENERLKADGWVKRVYQLEHQLEDMKCCGNCKKYKYLVHIKDGCWEQTRFPEDSCKNWVSDGMKRSER